MDAVNMTSETMGIVGASGTISTSQTIGQQGTASSTSMLAEPPTNVSKIKALSAIAERLGCNLVQLQVAWQIRNQTIQSTSISAATPEQLMEILNSLAFISKITHGTIEDIDKILCNKPARPPMISTLQQRWATTGGVPPC